MSFKGTKNGAPFVVVAIGVIFAIFFIQGYFFFQKKIPKPPIEKPIAKPVVRPVPQKPVALRPPNGETAGRIAIVIDDWGYNRTHCKYVQSIESPLGIAILPNQPYSNDIIQCTKAAGKEPMLHLPIEPHVYYDDYPKSDILMAGMAQAPARKLLKRFLDDMKGVVGVNNHMGSKGTEDAVLMTLVLSELKKRNLFFLDSFTSENSVCEAVAEKLKMRIGIRDVFLDNRNERVAIERQFALAARIAKKRGHALIIGHDRLLTLQIISEQVKKLKNEGFEFLPVKEYIRLYEYSRN